MNKSYFAKYLPVGGDIQKGEKYFNRRRNEIDICISNENGKASIELGDKKVKLFLCSRDIEAGDQIYLTKEALDSYNLDVIKYIKLPLTTKCMKVVDSDIWVEIEGEKYECEAGLNTTCFRMIGEISANALNYVKENDEFDQDEIILFKNNKISYTLCEVKGPCGHFH